MFMGTEQFALETLKALYEATKDSAQICVVTQTDKPRGRGHKVVFDCVKNFALEKNLTLYQPENLKRENFESTLSEEDPQMIIVASYGKILPKYVLDHPVCGCVCVHASLLPKYRGAAPINRVIMDGETTAGVTLMYMDPGIDTGNMIAKASLEIADRNAGQLRDALALLGAKLLTEHYPLLIKGICPSEPQNDAMSCYAEKITAQDRPIDFTQSAALIVAKIRGLAPSPGATCRVEASGLNLKILDAAVLTPSLPPQGKPGEVIRYPGMKKNVLAVQCGEGILLLTSVQPEGGKVMDAASLINGRKLSCSDQLV